MADIKPIWGQVACSWPGCGRAIYADPLSRCGAVRGPGGCGGHFCHEHLDAERPVLSLEGARCLSCAVKEHRG